MRCGISRTEPAAANQFQTKGAENTSIGMACAVATRYEKTARSFMDVLYLAAAFGWIKT
jgi:hypothetical protein